MEQAYNLGKSNDDHLPNLPKLAIELQSYHHILNIQETTLLFRNLDEIFQKIFELELHKTKMRKKLKANLNTSRMAEIDKTLNTTTTQLNETMKDYKHGGCDSARSNEKLLS